MSTSNANAVANTIDAGDPRMQLGLEIAERIEKLNRWIDEQEQARLGDAIETYLSERQRLIQSEESLLRGFGLAPEQMDQP